MTKTPEQIAEEYVDKNSGGECSDDTGGLRNAFFAGYQAAKSEYEAKIRELETELDNWKHCAVHGDDGL